MRPGWIAAILTTLLAVAPATADPPPAKGPGDPVQALREKYTKTPVAPLKIAEPVELKDVRYYKDGGSVAIVLRDAKKVEHRFCLDGRKPGVFPLVLNALHPAEEGARAVALGAPEEAALYGVLLRWAARHPKRALLFDASAPPDPDHPNLWEAGAFLLRLERRFTTKS